MFPSQLLDKYDVENRPIGKGAFGLIFKGMNKQNNENVAIKVLYYDKSYNINEFDEIVNNEINMMKLLNNEHSIKLYEYIKDKNDYYLILEYCDTDLEKYVSEKKGLKIYEIEKILKQLNIIYKKLLKLNCVHRDLKPSNILIKYKNEDKNDFDIKLSDYGLSKNLNSKKYFSSKVGSFNFMAPEILYNEKKKFNNSCDLWSIGIIIYFLYYNEIPFKENEIFQKNFKLNKFTDYKILEFLLKKLLVVDVEKRIKWEDDFKINFFNECYLTEMIELINNVKIKNELKNTQNLNQFSFMEIINKNLKNNNDNNIKEIQKLKKVINDLNIEIKNNKESINNLLKEIENKNKEIIKIQNENKILLNKYNLKNKNMNNLIDEETNNYQNFRLTGIYNQELNDFMSSVIQNLKNISIFTNKILKANDFNDNIISSFQNLLHNLIFSNEKNVSLLEFKKNFSQKNKIFEGKKDNDSTHFLIYLINYLHKRYNNINNTKISKNFDFLELKSNEKQVLFKFLNSYDSRNNSFIHDLF